MRAVIPSAIGLNGGGGTAGGGDLHIPPTKHGRTVYCYQPHYGPVSGVGVETGYKGFQEVVETGRGGCGRDAYYGLVGGTDGGGVGDGQGGE